MAEPKIDVAGWQELIESLAELPEKMLAKLPQEQRSNPQIQQEVARLALESLTSNTLTAIGGDGDAPQFLPVIGQLLNVGQPNADTVYRSCVIKPDGSYRLQGRRGSLALAVISQVIPGTNDRPHINLSELSVDANDQFNVIISRTKPEGYGGDWWQLDPASVQLLVRLVSADWGKEAEPTLTIERIDQPIQRHRTPAAILEQRLRQLPRMIEAMATMHVDQFAKLRAEGYINTLKILSLEFGALAGQFYYEGTFDLADDEALIIESDIPLKCDYRSLILTNEIYETIDWYNNHSSLNGMQSTADADGKLRIVVAARDPGVRNWLDTSGHSRGVIQGRWTGCDSHPIPTTHKMKISEVVAFLPSGVERVTEEERQTIIRNRRNALQQRPLW